MQCVSRICIAIGLFPARVSIHMGEEEKTWDYFFGSDGLGGIWTRDLTILKPSSYHWTTAPMRWCHRNGQRMHVYLSIQLFQFGILSYTSGWRGQECLVNHIHVKIEQVMLVFVLLSQCVRVIDVGLTPEAYCMLLLTSSRDMKLCLLSGPVWKSNCQQSFAIFVCLWIEMDLSLC